MALAMTRRVRYVFHFDINKVVVMRTMILK